MTSYVLRRLFHALTILLGVSILVFIFVEMAPGDAVDALMPPESMSTPEAKAAMRERLGLNDPAPLRYVQWLGRAVQGDMGYSLTSRRPVTDIIMARLPKTLLLVATAMVFSIIVGVSTGIISAIKQYSIIDYLATFFSFFWLSDSRVLPESHDDLYLCRAAELVSGVRRVIPERRAPDPRPHTSPDPASGGAGARAGRRADSLYPRESDGSHARRLYAHRPRQGPEGLGGHHFGMG